MGAIRENNQCCQFAASQARDGKAGGRTCEYGWSDA